MKAQWLFDTDVLVDYLRGVPEASSFLEMQFTKSLCCVSTITVAELYAGVREGKESATLAKFLGLFNVLGVTEAIAQQGGLYRRDYGKSHGIGLADAIIAATACLSEATLVTFNKKHYPMLEVVYVPY